MRLVSMALCSVVLLFATSTAQEAKKQDPPKEKEFAYPNKTPFDDDKANREGYLVGFSSGYHWAKGFHFFCPTNPGKGNLHVIRGWVEGWQAGVRDGGQGDLPARYAPFLVWRADEKD
ncbi:MAG: hypothetical protein L0Z50_42570 [Verrucomicrobiales bacterium]|nr:hypothetical protein [Verrucomicrobiales bacterium]